MTHVHFMTQLAAPPADRSRMGISYPKVAQNNTIHDRLVSRDLYWGRRPLSSGMIDESRDDERTIDVTIVESGGIPAKDQDISITSPVDSPGSSPTDDMTKPRFPSSKGVGLRMHQRIFGCQADVPSSLPPLTTPCASTDSSSGSSNSSESGSSDGSSGFLEVHMRRRETDLGHHHSRSPFGSEDERESQDD
ncbi:hypothetical protein EIP91_001322 [Steccherinum ochraceum]|uniref:Uncharacterized protein n=1 Tax=Steccherinum ochraceum TaxID=92696 RepID=A0A4V2MWK6_9APHY|nr:hypothetical protein EIP91_001322 [Steccherinum ochraceum]